MPANYDMVIYSNQKGDNVMKKNMKKDNKKISWNGLNKQQKQKQKQLDMLTFRSTAKQYA